MELMGNLWIIYLPKQVFFLENSNKAFQMDCLQMTWGHLSIIRGGGSIVNSRVILQMVCQPADN